MRYNKKLSALLHLVDDPDQEVFDTVAHQLLDYGTKIIPNLEQLWEVTEDEGVQYRIEVLIHRAFFAALQEDFLEWSGESNPSLLKGAILVARYRFPALDVTAVLSLFEQIKRNVWLELNNFMTPLEQINIINSLLYNYYKLEGHEITVRKPDLFFLNQVLENQKGNAYSIGVIYLALCEALDIPIFAVDIPRQFILGYFDNLYHFLSPQGIPDVQFYIDPINGIVYTQADVHLYLKKINGQMGSVQPFDNKQIIIKMLEELATTYEYNKEGDKAEELRHLALNLA